MAEYAYLPMRVSCPMRVQAGLINAKGYDASANVEAVRKAAIATDLVVLPGTEIQTYEEIISCACSTHLGNCKPCRRQWMPICHY
jgi:hypothetical protein